MGRSFLAFTFLHQKIARPIKYLQMMLGMMRSDYKICIRTGVAYTLRRSLNKGVMLNSYHESTAPVSMLILLSVSIL